MVNRKAISEKLLRHNIFTTFVAKLPFAEKIYQKYLPLMPLALEQLDLSDYDLVISSESGPAKGVITRPDALHVCYCHSPMRYIWDQYHVYISSAGRLVKTMFPWLSHKLRIWDVTSSSRVDYFIANSSAISLRIRKFYRRESVVIHPPCDIDTSDFTGVESGEKFYLMAGQLVRYKRPDLAIDAFVKMNKKLVVIGGGEEFERLKAQANNSIKFLGRVDDQTLRNYYASCEALVFPGEEDFGIVPVEVMAFGKPVIALGRGGALDTVVDGVTGVFFKKDSVDSLIDAVERFEIMKNELDPEKIKLHAQQFSTKSFLTKFQNFINSVDVR